MTTLIGNKITVSIGGEPPKRNNDEIIGKETVLHVPSESIGQYDNIIGESINMVVGDDIDEIMKKIITVSQNVDMSNKTELLELCRTVLNEQNRDNKMTWIPKIISLGANIAQIASLIIQLKTFTSSQI